MMQDVLSIPKWLHSLHGEHSTAADIAYTHVTGWGITALLFWLGIAAGYPLWFNLVLAVLAIDIAGGVISNVTRGTNDYYNARPRKRIVFLQLHIIQPAVLMLLFPSDILLISITSAATLATAFAINASGARNSMKAPAIALTTLAATLLVLIPAEFAGLSIILILYVMKVGLAFPVDWYK